MASTPLISTADLVPRLADRPLRIVDCRFELSDPQAGARAYAISRIPHARHADLNRDLSDLGRSAVHGRHPLPDMTRLAASLARLDLTRDAHIVAYDQDSGVYAARLWWLLRCLGFSHVKVLDGGFAAWQSEGLPVETGPPPLRPASRLPAHLHLAATAWLDADAVQRGLADRAILLLDARGAQRFRGEVEPIDPVAGHVPGAINRPFTENLKPDGRFKDASQLRAEFGELLGGYAPTQVVHMCGSGVTACHNRLAMDHAGLRGSRLYPDSWSGWICDPARPVAVGV
ncbi:MAG: sulfurtransferase [Xanthomonadales bacterium]|nr:putative thiosulfate sulfurtransferase SseB [Xanthomonadales bacterium]MCC6592664.1 sulfurtransferase [Xanthomonadales bacterium]MCE7930788.1 sulfurtransferase [Xanthomonadales bacterium PRO6]